ncbi:hypothetical protein D3C85_918460 [compost metagenome]
MVGTADHGRIVHAGDGTCHPCGSVVQAVGDGVFEGDAAIEIWCWRKDQLTIAEGHCAIVDGHGAAFGDGLAVDGVDGQAIAVDIGIVAGHIDGDCAILRHAELIIHGRGWGVHYAVVGAFGRGIAHRIGQGGIDRDGAVDRQIGRGDGQIDLSLVDVICGQDGAAVRHAITIPVHIEAIARLGVGRQVDDDIHPMLPLVGGDDVVRAILNVHQRCRRRRAVHAAIIGGGAGIAVGIGH